MVVTLPKLYIFRDLHQKKKCQTDDDISPSKNSRRKEGKGSGSVHNKAIALVKKSRYIPKRLAQKIERMNLTFHGISEKPFKSRFHPKPDSQ